MLYCPVQWTAWLIVIRPLLWRSSPVSTAKANFGGHKCKDDHDV